MVDNRVTELVALAASTLLLAHPSASAQRIGDIIYHGRDLGLPLSVAVSQVQSTGSSNNNSYQFADFTNIAVTGSGDQFVCTFSRRDGSTMMNSVSYRALLYTDVPVEVSGWMGSYQIQLGSASHTAVSGRDTGQGNSGSRQASQMIFSLYDSADTPRIRHLADLLATIGARLQKRPKNSAVGATNFPQQSIANATKRSGRKSRADVDHADPTSAPDAMGTIVATMDSGAHSLGSDGGSNYIYFLNTSKAWVTLTAWTDNCVNLEVAMCGTIITSARIGPGAETGFWINRNSNSDGAWSYTVGCSVNPGATAQCDLGGGGPAAVTVSQDQTGQQ